MKMNKLLNNTLMVLLPLITIVGCGQTSLTPDITPPPSIPFSSIDMENHEHVFDQQVTIARYRCEGTTCGNAATYYYSCVCGEKGTETFTDGSAASHSYQLIIEG